MKVFVHLAASLLILGVSNALDCHTCDSDRLGEEYCSAVPFKKQKTDTTMSCEVSFNNAFSAFKSNFNEAQHDSKLDSCVKHTYKDEHGQVKRVVRGCATGYDNVCSVFQQNPNNQYHCTYCKENYCNSATSISIAFGALAALALTLKL